MPLYVISYDDHPQRDYTRCYELMNEWSAQRLLESFWLAELRGPAEVVRDIVSETFGGHASVAVIELNPVAQWATRKAKAGGVDWLWAHIPYRA